MKSGVAFIILILITITSASVYSINNSEMQDLFGDNNETSVIVVLKDNPNPLKLQAKNLKLDSFEVKKNMIVQQKKSVLQNMKLKKGNAISVQSADYDLEMTHDYTSVNGFAVKITQAGYEKLKNNPNVLQIYKPKKLSLLLQDSAGIINATRTWGLVYNGQNITGKGETVCIIDTGIDYTRPALGGCTSGSFTSGTCSKVIGGYDIINGDNDPFDDNGHGTHVAGIVASNDTTYKGIAPDANIVALKIFPASGSATTQDLISAIDWCTNNASIFNISIISMSLGDGSTNSNYCDSSDQLTANSIHNAIARNISVVVAAGNSNSASGVSDPACISNVTVAGSVSKSDVASSYNRWNLPILLAPGESITSTVPTGSCSSCDPSGFKSLSGTSMATPHISGAFALLRQYKKLEQNIALTPFQLQNASNYTGKQISDLGSGLTLSRINAYLALLSLDATAPNITLVAPTPANNSNVTINSTNYVFINLTSNEVLNSAILEIDNGTKTNASMALSGLNAYINLTALKLGVISYRIYANDSAGNSNVTGLNVLQINNTAPNISAFSPSQSFSISEPSNQTFSINFSDTENDAVVFSWYLNNSLYLNGINKTEFNFTGNFTSAGVYNVNVTLTDGSLQSFLSWNLTVNNTNRPVNITSFFPLQNVFSINKSSNQTFNITYSDLDADDIISISWYQNSTLKSNSTNFTFITNLSAVGFYNITVTVSDGINATLQLWNLTVLNNAPILTSVNLTNTDFLNRTNGTLQASWEFNDVDGDQIMYNETIWYVNYTLDSNYTNQTFINSSNTTRFENWTFSVRIFDGFDWSSWTNSSNITILNAAPILSAISNITVNESDLVNINATGSVSATDVDGDNIAFTYSAPLNSSGQWQTGYTDARNYTITVTANDSNGGITAQNALISVLDKVNGANDTIIGNLSDIATNIPNLNLIISNITFNSSLNFTGTNKINFTNGNSTIIEFDYNFSNASKFNFVGVRINSTLQNGSQSIIISGIDLTSQGKTKTVYMNRTNATYNSVCVKDTELSSVDQISIGCSASGETKVSCDGSSTGGFTCTLLATTYKITGLSHSGIRQISYTPSGGGGDNSGGGGGGGGSSGGGGGGGGGQGYVCNMDWKCGEWSACLNGMQARECNFIKVLQHVQEAECPDVSKIPTTAQVCEIKKSPINKSAPISFQLQTIQKPEETANNTKQPQARNGLSWITGSLIQMVKNKSVLTALVFAAVAIAGIFVFNNYKKKKNGIPKR